MISLVRRAWLALVLTLVWLPITGYAQGNTGDEPLRVRLVHQRVVTGADGGERYVPAEHAKPGDLIEYRATYSNQVQTNLSGVLATLPIPAGMLYTPADITPKPVLASLDGARFEPVPIKRMLRNPDGTKALKEVPLEEYHALRWTLEAIRAGQAKPVRTRMRITPAAVTEGAPASASTQAMPGPGTPAGRQYRRARLLIGEPPLGGFESVDRPQQR